MIWAGIAQALLAAAIYFLSLLILLRLLRSEPAFVVLATTGPVYVIAFALLLVAGQRVNFWVFSTSYWFFVLSFLMAFGAIYKSLSLRILLQLAEAPDRTGSLAAMRESYVHGESFNDRLQIIVARGLAERTAAGLSLTPRGRAFAGGVRGLQRAFGIKRSG